MRRRSTVLLLSAALTIGGLAVAVPAEAMTTGQAASSLVSRVNAVRSAHRVPALAANAVLNRRAAAHADLVVRTGRLTYRLPGESPVATQLRAERYAASYAVQLVAWSPTLAGLLQTPATSRDRTLTGPVLGRTPTQVGMAVRYVPRAHRYVMSLVLARPGVAAAARPAAQSTAQLYASRVLAQLNAERRAHGLPLLSMNSQLVASAHGHNLTMAAHDQLSHQLPGERFFADRILRAGYRYRYAGENIGWNSDTSLGGVLLLETMMYNEKAPNDGHRQNILSRNYTNVGIDVYFDTVHRKVWLTEDFGSR